MTLTRSTSDIPLKRTVYPTITAGAYSAGDVVGGLLTFPIASDRGASGMVRSVRIADNDNEKAACTLWLFERTPTTFADNAAFAPTYTDLKYCAAVLSIGASDYTTAGTRAMAALHDRGADFAIEQGNLYGYLVCTATPTYTTTSDLAITLTFYML